MHAISDGKGNPNPKRFELQMLSITTKMCIVPVSIISNDMNTHII